jgi:hypothetical protein
MILLGTISISCQKDELRQKDENYQPDISASKFTNSTNLTNVYFPVLAGVTYTYEGQTPDGFEMVEERRLNTTRIVEGIECVAVNYKAYLDGILIEEAEDWYAQDNDGNVWYFGEEVDNFNPDGSFRDHGGSWEAGVDGAKAGIIMLATPTAGAAYREEYFFNEAEDEAEIVNIGLSVTIPYGQFDMCIQTHNWTELEPDLNEHKFYAPGVGLIKEVDLTDQFEIVLVSIR